MANDKAFKIKNGLVAQRYLQSAGTETAGTVGYSLSGASYSNNSLDVSAQTLQPQSLVMSSDGTRVILLDATNAAPRLLQYNLSTAYDITTATVQASSFSLSSQTLYPYTISVAGSGTKVYVMGESNTAYQYNLSTAWDVSTASYSGNSFSTLSQDDSSVGIYVKNDGTKLYIRGTTTDYMYQYTMSTFYDISTASYDNKYLYTSTTSAGVQGFGFTFKDDGTSLFTVDYSTDNVNEFYLTTAWDISTGTYTGVSFRVNAQETSPIDLTFSDSGSKMYVIGTTNDTIFQYSTVADSVTMDLSTGTYFSFSVNGATSVSFTNPPASGLAIAFVAEVTGDGSSIVWPSSIKWNSGVAPTATASKELYTFITVDGGATYYGKKAAGEFA